jgi:NADPH:quinone reductase-like Zn-dependent oxidoreductase
MSNTLIKIQNHGRLLLKMDATNATADNRRWEAKKHGGPDGLELVNFQTKQPSAKEVVVKVFATTATYTDLLIIAGNYRPVFPLPVTPGYDLVGSIKAVGTGVTTLNVGDIVVSMPQNGCMATEVVLPEHLCLKIDSCFDPEKVVSMVLTGVTAHQMLHRVAGKRINSNASILVHGAAGGTGAMIVQLAKLAGVAPGNIYGKWQTSPFPASLPPHTCAR